MSFPFSETLESTIEIDSKYELGIDRSFLEVTDKKTSALNVDDCYIHGMFCCPNDLCGRK